MNEISQGLPQPSDRVDTERVNFADLSHQEDNMNKSEADFALPTPAKKIVQKVKKSSSLKDAKILTGSEKKISSVTDLNSEKNSHAEFNLCICVLALVFKGITLFV